MILKDYHMHTCYCDGKNTAEEMVQAAIAAGLTEMGISEHSHTAFDDTYCLSEEATHKFRQEMQNLREKYKDQIPIRIGLEMDRWSDADLSGFDYAIGSMHYIRVPDRPGITPPKSCFPWEENGQRYVYISVDETPQILRAAADAYFAGDAVSMAEMYFEEVADVAHATGCAIIGHFDLITKFNEQDPFFDTGDPRYIAAWKKVVDKLLPYDIPFEINTGAMSKGYRSSPYPARDIREYIRAHGGRFILSSDSHRTDTLCFAFDRYEAEV